jgi:transmembrane sensor
MTRYMSLNNPPPIIMPSASGAPIARHIVLAAADWMALLWSDESSDNDRARCMAWRQSHPDHERAWLRLQAMENRFDDVPHGVARHALLQPAITANQKRRKAIRLFSLLLATGGVAYTARKTDTWQMVMSDHSTSTGEIRDMTLPDGTRIALNTATAIDVRFDGQERAITLRSGEIFITTAPDNATSHRPFRVYTPQGRVEALGTRFIVRQQGELARVAVYQGAVAVTPKHGNRSPVRLDAGQQTEFGLINVAAPVVAQEQDTAWSSGVLVAENMQLATFVETLGRYRVGVVRCDPAIANLLVTGVFSLRDTDRALESLALPLPVEVVYRTRYWVTVRAKTVS